MNREEIRKILNYPSIEMVNLALGYVNLTEKEKQIIKYVEMECITEERTAEKLDISVRNLQKIKSNAFDKISKVWSRNFFISLLLERV